MSLCIQNLEHQCKEMFGSHFIISIRIWLNACTINAGLFKTSVQTVNSALMFNNETKTWKVMSVSLAASLMIDDWFAEAISISQSQAITTCLSNFPTFHQCGGSTYSLSSCSRVLGRWATAQRKIMIKFHIKVNSRCLYCNICIICF